MPYIYSVTPIRYIIIGIFFLVILTSKSIAQETQRHSYSILNSKDGMSKQVINNIIEDKYGIIWLVSQNNVQWFDGSNFHQVPFGNGPHQIPGTLFHTASISSNKDVWFFYEEGYSVYNPDKASFLHFKKNEINNTNQGTRFISSIKNEMVLHGNGVYQFIDNKTKQVSKVIKKSRNAFSPAITHFKNELTVITEDKQGRHFENINTGSSILLPSPIKTNYLIYYQINDSIVTYFSVDCYIVFNLHTKSIQKIGAYPKGHELKPFASIGYIINKDEQTSLVILENEIWEFDNYNWNFIRKLVGPNGKSILDKGYFKSIFLDSKGVLWASSNLNGLYNISLKKQYIHLYASDDDKENFVKCFYPDKTNNCIVTGTFGAGLVIYDSLGKIIKKYPLKKIDENAGTIVSSITELNKDLLLILLYGRSDIYLLNRKTLELKKANTFFKNKELQHEKPNYYSIPLKFKDNLIFYSLGNLIFKIEYLNSQLVFERAPRVFTSSKTNGAPLYTKNESLIEISNSKYVKNCLAKIGLTSYGLEFQILRKNNYILGTNKGLYEFDDQEQLLHSWNIQNGLPDENIYSAIIDKNNQIWCAHDKGISKIDNKGIITNFSKSDGLQDDEFNYAAIAETADGELFFGGIKGLNAFYPTQLNLDKEIPSLLITKVSSNENSQPNDTAFWNIQNLEFQHKDNRIKIQFSAIGSKLGNAYNYQYRVIGLDKEWKNLLHVREINLALSPGTYQIEIAAGKLFDKNLKAQKILEIIVRSPIYLRWWFLLLATLSFFATTWYIIKLISQRRYRKKMQSLAMLEQLEKERQRISRDLHDNMGAYTSALMANVDKLKTIQGEHTELNKIQSNAEQILNSLRETIWVLNNKETTVSDFSDGFKTYCFNVLKNFEEISFESDEEIENNCVLSASSAIHLNKLLQEIVQNIIKHSQSRLIYYQIICNQHLIISIRDNGIGFDPNKKYTGNGLENMEWRAAEAGASLKIESDKKSGTKITIQKQMLL